MENVAYAFDFYGILHLLRYQHIPFEIGIALHYVPNAHCWVYITDPIRSDDTVTILYMKSYAIAFVRNDTIAQLL